HLNYIEGWSSAWQRWNNNLSELGQKHGKRGTNQWLYSKTDQSLKGIKTLAKKDPEKAQAAADQIIRNTYRTLMTRGQKGCFVFCTNPELNAYFEERLQRARTYNDVSPGRVLSVAEDREGY
ncbi:DNA/RNA helicase domain-containing protein, partial [Cytobacillus firmus]|uniref:DNA/RNA helicase domain-containing protein n=1 Tax=Cytobacillus firmus TaxID=1399 RepID=UPI003BA0B026